MDSPAKERWLNLVSIPTLVLALLGLIISKIIWSFLFHPLRHIPGPALAKVTDLWHLYHCWGGKRHHKLVELHKKYGIGIPLIQSGNHFPVANAEERPFCSNWT